MGRYCKNCGAELGEAKFCPECGKPAETESIANTQGTDSKTEDYTLFKWQLEQQKKKQKKKKIAIILTAFCFVAFIAIIATVSNGTNPNHDPVSAPDANIKQILDVNEYAGISIDDLKTKVEGLDDGEEYETMDANGNILNATCYSNADESLIFYVMDDKVFQMQYDALNTPVSFSREKDIFAMFGITPASNLSKDLDIETRRDFSSVSESVSHFSVNQIDTEKKTFGFVGITFDSKFGGKFSNEPEKPNLEVLEFEVTSDDFMRYGVGRIKNNTDKTYSYVQVSINMYKGDALVGSTLDNVNNLGPGEVWEFKALILSDEANYFKVYEVTGF